MGIQKPSYEELEVRLTEAENELNAIRKGNVDAIVSKDGIYLLRLNEMEQALRESEERFRIMADGTPLMIWVTDTKGNIEFVNRAYRDYFGVTIDDALALRWQLMLHPEDKEAYTNAYSQALDEQQSFFAQVRVKRNDGQWRWIESHGVSRFSSDGQYLGITGSSLDITEQKNMEDQLRTAKELLEKRVAERTAELVLRTEQLARLTSELTLAEQRERKRTAEFLHDNLQQLMVGAKIGQEVLIQSIGNDLKPAAEKILDLINQSISASSSLTMELAPPVLWSGDLSASLKWLAEWIGKTYGMDVKIRAENSLVLKRKDLIILLFQSVRELLFNTVKHANVNSAEIVLSYNEKRLNISVIDQGCGFDPEKVWEGAANSGRFGLFSIRERLMLMGGTFTVESTQGNGARFSLIVPL